MPNRDGTGPPLTRRRRQRRCRKSSNFARLPGARFRNFATISYLVSSAIVTDLQKPDSRFKIIGNSFIRALNNHKKRIKNLSGQNNKRLQAAQKNTIFIEGNSKDIQE